MPQDFSIVHAVAMIAIAVCWFGYSFLLNLFAKGSLNLQLTTVRQHWVWAMTRRIQQPYDAILVGHITNAIAFFGSATLLVLAGVISIFAVVGEVHELLSRVRFVEPASLELFELKLAFVSVVLAICFFSFTYALRKFVYLIALLGALPQHDAKCPTEATLVQATVVVMSEAIRTFNFGIRGYYYAIAAVCMLASAWLSLFATAIVTVVLFYRQLATPTSQAIAKYVEAADSLNCGGTNRDSW